MNDSKILGVSLRGWLAAVLILTVCGMSVASIPITEPLYTLATVAAGVYFGQKKTET